MWQQIALNKRNSCILLTLMLLVMLLLGAAFGVLFSYYFCDVFYINEAGGMIEKTDAMAIMLKSAQDGIIVALIVWIILFLTALVNGKRAILSLNHAYKLPKNAHRILENVVEEMTIASGLPKMPEIYVIDTPMPNAFATGLTPNNCAIAVTTGLLTELNREELQGVVAHEIAHIVNRDTMYMIFAGIMIGTIVLLSDLGLRYLRYGRYRTSRSRNSGKADVILFFACIILMILAPVLAQILYFSISQRREYLADACAVQFTRYPQGLASALTKISASLYMFRDADKITSAMYIVHPLDYEIRYKNTYSMFGNIFTTHPPTEKRIEILSKMAGADFNAYNEAFKKVSRGKTILNKEFLYGTTPLKIVTPEEAKPTVSSGITAGVVGAAVGAAVLSNAEELITEKRKRKRVAQDIVWKANDYIFKECECGTKFKIPQEYNGTEITCPHCGKVIFVQN